MKLLKTVFIIALLAWFQSTMSQPLWMRYPAISPDGQTIVFSYKGDLYKVPASGGQAAPMTIHSAYDFKPIWSPDGRYIAFASNRFGNFDIFLIPASGGTAKRLTYHSGDDMPNCFSPDGKYVIFSATIMDHPENVQFPSGILSELYKVPVDGEHITQILSTPAEETVISKDGTKYLYHDRKGYENVWRKHHESAVARDIWLYDATSGKHEKITSFDGEDRNPVFGPGANEVYFLSEQFGDFNVCKTNLDQPGNVTQISNFKNHPVRFLTISNQGILCYGYDGELYTQVDNEAPQKVPVTLDMDFETSNVDFMKMSSEATEMDLSPNGKEIAFVVRGEVFVTSTDYGTTKRVTNTPEQERSVDFSPDGRSLVYASERNGSWNLYISTIVRDEEGYFAHATLLDEKPLLEIPEETFQPNFSPDGKEVAYLEDRIKLKVIHINTKETRTILDGQYNYSYSDGDQHYQWSPDGKWFLVSFTPHHWQIDEVGLVRSDGSEGVINLTKSGYSDAAPVWMMKGDAVLWFTDRNGYRSHGSWGAHFDAYAMFLNKKSWDQFRLSKEEFELLKETEKEKEKEQKKEDSPTRKKGKPEVDLKEAEDIDIQLESIEDRTARLTIHSSSLADAILSPEGDKLYYLARFEEGYDLWLHDLKKDETKLVVKLKGRGGSMEADSAFNNLYVFSGGKIVKVGTKDHQQTPVTFNAEMNLDKTVEREYMFEHVWRQVREKWYHPDLHGVDWSFYKAAYQKFLPHINNNFDYAEMLSEMLGELNGSHTGSGYRFNDPHGEETARLGVFFDDQFAGPGLKIAEIIDKSPLIQEDSKIKVGTIIEKIDGQIIGMDQNYFKLLNHKNGKPTLLSLFDPEANVRWDETVKPISNGQESQLLYERWVKARRAETDRLSNGRIGYLHVRGMNSSSFREAYSEMLGRNHEKEALIVDTRFNGGGWLHDDLATLLNGKRYADFYPGGTYFGSEPRTKWYKPSIVIVSESNYSDAHGFPYAYRSLGIGKIVGMPVPGTMTAVWWETLQDESLYFGIPQVGTKDMNGHYLENQQMEPDYMVRQDYDVVVRGRDQQLEKAVEVLLQELENK